MRSCKIHNYRLVDPLMTMRLYVYDVLGYGFLTETERNYWRNRINIIYHNNIILIKTMMYVAYILYIHIEKWIFIYYIVESDLATLCANLSKIFTPNTHTYIYIWYRYLMFNNCMHVVDVFYWWSRKRKRNYTTITIIMITIIPRTVNKKNRKRKRKNVVDRGENHGNFSIMCRQTVYIILYNVFSEYI